MDGMHDLGGKQGFGPVVRTDDSRRFKERWELEATAISGRLVGAGLYNMDEYRHAIERMDPCHYMAASYYERVLTAAATLCVEKGLLTQQALADAAGGAYPLSRPIGPGRAAARPERVLQVGDTVRVKNEFVSGHTRMPGYIRGQTGVIVDVSPAYPYPDACGHALPSTVEPTFDVRFDARDLWPDSSEAAFVHVGVFASYLEYVGPP
ncbi:nitrile hydratase subunit beta [Xylophilus sp. GOD-11R]|uniref:nitrile hydratase subunit beta n=1 Tax=Xylophilus sp. GOD-11R TaxID=3089814 RepID=UPI00298BF80F|nr:nitrile hydratase subunit beta [Xylophilus sp. GOD-11R]WPB58256.1 nitrile hydratase subunit beta [Xylophilus sp. GOD-11R]